LTAAHYTIMKKLLIFVFLMLAFSANAQKKKISYKRFSGTITIISEDAIKYDDELLIILHTETRLKQLFETGILYPAIIRSSAGIKVSTVPTAAVSTIKHDFTIQKVQLVRSKSKSGKIRKFKFELYQNDIADPTEYFIELRNPKASFKTDIKKFIRGAKLTAVKRGSIVI